LVWNLRSLVFADEGEPANYLCAAFGRATLPRNRPGGRASVLASPNLSAPPPRPRREEEIGNRKKRGERKEGRLGGNLDPPWELRVTESR